MTPAQKLQAFLHTPHFHVVPFAMEHLGLVLLVAYALAGVAYWALIILIAGTLDVGDILIWLPFVIVTWPVALFIQILSSLDLNKVIWRRK